MSDEPVGRAPANAGEVRPSRLEDVTGEVLPALIARLRASRLGELEVRSGGWRIRLRRDPSAAVRATAHAGKAADEPEAPGLHFWFGRVAIQGGGFAQAAEAFERYLEAGGAHPYARFGLATAYEGLGRFEEALRLHVELARDNPALAISARQHQARLANKVLAAMARQSAPSQPAVHPRRGCRTAPVPRLR